MKKTILIILTVLSSFLVNAQTKSNLIDETSIGPITSITYKEYINLSTIDTTKMISLLFSDGRYTHLISYEGIYFADPDRDTTEINQFISDLKNMITNMGSGSDLHIDRGNYRMFNSDIFPRSIFLYNKDGAYTIINKNQSIRLIEWIKSLNL